MSAVASDAVDVGAVVLNADSVRSVPVNAVAAECFFSNAVVACVIALTFRLEI